MAGRHPTPDWQEDAFPLSLSGGVGGTAQVPISIMLAADLDPLRYWYSSILHMYYKSNQFNSIFCCSLLAFRIKLWNRLLYVIDLLCCSNPICLSCELFCACWLVLLLGLCFLSVAADWPITDCQAHWAYFHNESESAWPTQTRGDRGQAAMGRAKSVIHSTLFPFAVLLQ